VDLSEARRLKVLEEANAKLKQLLANSMPDNVALKDLPQKVAMPPAHREAAAHLRSVYEMSERWDLFAGSEDI
jgi:hypothetical protein